MWSCCVRYSSASSCALMTVDFMRWITPAPQWSCGPQPRPAGAWCTATPLSAAAWWPTPAPEAPPAPPRDRAWLACAPCPWHHRRACGPASECSGQAQRGQTPFSSAGTARHARGPRTAPRRAWRLP
eukprot:scaffold58114_cov62-Phaeocystis_antarctica.AAC.3